ncbi:MAG: protein kinase [Acidobacteria bacterium]|nr:protein kinase [Acidobacteriota bacterium]
MTCPSCASEIKDASRFCSTCGAGLEATSVAPTRTSLRDLGVSSGALDDARFIPGTLLAGRYRIIGLLGKGGMGEVYRADDLKLGQPVALKFLPEAFASDPVRLNRFLNEVKIARQVSHPNVCRVYDVGEVEGQHYLSMEYVDGEDLASLLRRIGHLPQDKAIEVSRQICAGLAAAHDRGVLHRDLKPANVMIDGRGKVRLTDFGLAGLAGGFKEGEIRAGTPAYMAPEQLEGREVSAKSDIYALGLVLYEMFAGTHPYKADSVAEMARKREQATPGSLSSRVKDLDPAVERAILRCLEKDPKARPASAIAVAASLPGGDPLRAALAAGETPSPEMVAAAGDVGGLKPAIAWALLVSTLGLVALVVVLTGKTSLLDRITLAKSPEALSERAREVLHRLGHVAPAVDSARGFNPDGDYLQWVAKNDPSPTRWARLASARPPSLFFWYRESPRPIIGKKTISVVEPFDPPLDVPGMALVGLDPAGGLIGFVEVPPSMSDPNAAPGVEPDWSVLFAESGIDMKAFTRVDSIWTPPVYCDARAAWEGPLPGHPETKIRLEAGGWHGRPNYFLTMGPWSRPISDSIDPPPSAMSLSGNVEVLIQLVPLIAAIFLARRNLKAGRGDRSGAFRVGLGFLLVHFVVWAIMANHTGNLPEEWGMLQRTSGWTLYYAVTLWLSYLALEPYVRRRWPDALISWTRLLGGRVRDPLLGRDLLTGSLVGVTLALLFQLASLAPSWMGRPLGTPNTPDFNALTGPGFLVAILLDFMVHSVVIAMGVLFILFLLRVFLRREWLAAVGLSLIISMQVVLGNDLLPLAALFASAAVGLFTFTMMRHGFLAATVAMMVSRWLNELPLPSNWHAWYAGMSTLVPLTVAALAVYGFTIALAGKPIFGGNLLED